MGLKFKRKKVRSEIVEKKDKRNRNQGPKAAQTTIISVALIFVFLCVILVTGEISKLNGFELLARHEKTVINSEFAVFSIVLVEFIGRAIIQAFKRRGNEPTGHNIRAIIRGVVYIILVIGIVSSLSSDPGLAIGIGTVTGVVIAFATQNLVGNVVAGVMLAIVRPVRIGDDITVMAQTGKVKEIDLLYTVLEDGENWYYVPSMVMFSNVIKKKKISMYKHT